MMYKNKIIVFGIIAALLLCSVLPIEASGENTITIDINIGSYKIISKEYGQEIFVENFGHNLIPGKPNIPSKIFSIAIPPNAEVTGVRYEISKKIVIPGRFDIMPVPLPEVIGEVNPKVSERENRIYEENYNQIYRSDDPYPENPVEIVRTAGYRKYNLVDVRVTPFTYKPLSKELTYYPEITIDIFYEFAENPQENIDDNIVRTEKNAERIITNYEEAQNWYETTTAKSGLYDFVIVTLDSLTNAVTSLVDWESMKGKNVNVVTTSWIDLNYNGYDLAEKIRNFLRDKYPSSEWGIEDVLMVGHRDNLPMRLCWQDMGYGKPETDFYYAELSLPDNQSWDIDGDHHWGENGDPIDMYAEINVGRIPWSDPATVTHICDKSVAYEQNNDPSFKKNMLLLGAFFWPDTDNAVLMEYKTDDSIHPWMSDWTTTKLYEQSQSSYPSDYNLDYNNVQNVWSSGTYAFVNWAGHGSPTACYEYYPSQAFVDTATCQYLNDDYPAIIFADACSNSDTSYTNIGMKMLEQGGVGFLGATKVAYGYHGWDDPYDGAASSMDYFFTSCVTSGAYTQGAAHQYALAEMYAYGLWYYPKFETFEWGALWGNPDLGMEYYPSSVTVNITYVKAGWNFVSLPFNLSVNLDDLVINYGAVNYSWSEAIDPVNGPIVDPNVFGWDRDQDMYIFISDSLEPGYGYWMYSYADCELRVQNINPLFDDYITDPKTGWNIIGLPYNQPVNLINIIVNYNGIDYTWADATDPVNGPIVDPNVFGWDRDMHMYIMISDILEPGYAYWIYSYQDCTLRYSDMPLKGGREPDRKPPTINPPSSP